MMPYLLVDINHTDTLPDHNADLQLVDIHHTDTLADHNDALPTS